MTELPPSSDAVLRDAAQSADAVRSADDSMLRARVLEVVKQSTGHVADSMATTAFGWVVRSPSLPLVWSLNQIWCDEPPSRSDVVGLSDEYQSDLSFRHVVFDDRPGAHELVADLVADGWTCERAVLMAMTEPPTLSARTEDVVELTEAQMLWLMGEWLAEERPQINEEGLRQVLEYNRREGVHWAERRLGILGPDGQPVAVTKLRARDPVRWIEDVYTRPGGRQRGHSRALLTAALRDAWASKPAFTFIIADDDDWPKAFYARLGFVPVGWFFTCHRDRR